MASQMQNITISYNHSLINDQEFSDQKKQVIPEISTMIKATQKGYEDNHASINLPFDESLLHNIKQLINEKKSLNISYIIVVGIGGSNLGTIAIQEALLGKHYNELKPATKILYADTVDSDQLHAVLSIIEPILQNGENVLINAVSKSGGTTETIANFEVLIKLLQKYKQDYEKYVVVTSDKESKFWNLALEKGFSVLEIPKKVGGRFSVFSAVGLFPLGFIGISIDDLIDGAKNMRDACIQEDVTKNPAAVSACQIYAHFLKGKNIHDLFIFSTDFESVGKWYRQLMGESIGKEFDKSKNKVYAGITPTVSIGSTDLHSMAQLYLGGPYDKFTTFIRVKNKQEIILPDFPEYELLVPHIQNRPLSEIMDAILEGVQKAFVQSNRPFMQCVLPEKSAYYLGQFLQLKMMEMMYLGFLLNVNPFDQPNVEEYKVETKKILGKKSDYTKKYSV